MRASQSEIERESIREVDRARKHVKRYRETVEQKQIRNEESRKRIKVLPENRQVEAQEQNTSVNAVEERRRRNYNFENEAFRYDPTKEYSKHPSVVIGKMDKICEFCGAKKFKGETLSMCCKGGKVKLSSLQVPPPELFSYMSGETPESKHFLQSIRRYNACFQMTSFGATCVHEKDGLVLYSKYKDKSITKWDHYCQFQMKRQNFCNCILWVMNNWKWINAVPIVWVMNNWKWINAVPTLWDYDGK